MSTPLISVRKLNVRFGGVHAVQDVTFDVPDSGIYGIIGPNGAGKTTLFNCISGFVRPVRGTSILFKDAELVGQAVHRIARAGIARTFQGIALNPTKTVQQNLMTGLHQSLSYLPWSAFFPGRKVRSEEAAAEKSIRSSLELLGLDPSILDVTVDVLPLGLQKKVEVARAVVSRPRVLLLDEPAGGLNDSETSELRKSLKLLSETVELTIVLIDHDMNLVMPLCDTVLALSLGKRVAEGSPAHIQANPAVIESYLGGVVDA